MKILHLSDTHGFPFWEKPILSEIDLVIHTGDLILDQGYGLDNLPLEVAHANEVLKEICPKISSWLDGRELLYVPGNHDFAELNCFMTEAIRLTPKPVMILGKNFAGYAGIPYIYGQWNYELDSNALRDLLCETLSNFPDILVTHCGPAGILSNGPYGESYGCKTQSSILNGSGFGSVSHHLFGHIHCGPTIANIAGITFSNAAGGPKSAAGNILNI